MESAGRRHGRGGARVGTNGADERRRNADKCPSLVTGCDRENENGRVRPRWKETDGWCAISFGKLWPERAREIFAESVSAGRHGRRIRIQDQYAPAPVAEAKGQKIFGG